MKMTLVMYYLTLPPELDATLFDDVSTFLSLDVSYEVQQTTVEFISKLHTIIDKFTYLQTEPILSNIRTHYNLETKQEVILAVGFAEMEWYRNDAKTDPEVIEAYAAFKAWVAAYNMTVGDVRYHEIDVDFYPESCVFFGMPVNFPELKYLYDNGITFNENPV